MNVFVYSPSVAILGVADIYNTLIWVRKFYEFGTFEFTVPVTKNNIQLLAVGNIIRKENDDEMAYIKSVEIVHKNDEISFKVVGSFYMAVLSQRVVLQNYKNLRDLIVNNARELPCLTVADNLQYIKFTNDFTGFNLGDAVNTVCLSHNFGVKAVLDGNSIKIVAYDGTDKSVAQTENPYCIFSESLGSLSGTEYSYSTFGAVNTVYVRCTVGDNVNIDDNGIAQYEARSAEIDEELQTLDIAWHEASTQSEKDNIQKQIDSLIVERNEVNEILLTLYSLPSGLPQYNLIAENDTKRYEKYITAECETFVGIGGLTFVDYPKTMDKIIKLANAEIVPMQKSFVGTVNFKLRYKIDYDLGDIVTVKNDEWGLSENLKITEVTEVYDNTENSVTPTFGAPVRTIVDILKKVM